MEEIDSVKVTGIRHIVRLRELLQRWQNATIRAKQLNNLQQVQVVQPHHPRGVPPEVTRRLWSATITSDSDDEGSFSPEPPPDVPRGYLAVYIGSEYRRFIVPTAYLGHKLFKTLLEKAEEEYGFDHGGALTIPCEVETFKYLLKCIESEERNSTSTSKNEIVSRERSSINSNQIGNLSKEKGSINTGENVDLRKEKGLINSGQVGCLSKEKGSINCSQIGYLSKKKYSSNTSQIGNLSMEKISIKAGGNENLKKGKSSTVIQVDETLSKGKCLIVIGEDEDSSKQKYLSNTKEVEDLEKMICMIENENVSKEKCLTITGENELVGKEKYLITAVEESANRGKEVNA